MGAGVGGLATAHKLVKKGYEVHILERNPEVGGLARSRFTSNGEHSEYCWHVFCHGYVSLIPLLQEIPFKGSSVANQLKPMTQLAYGRNGNHFWLESGTRNFVVQKSITKFLDAMKKMGYTCTYKGN